MWLTFTQPWCCLPFSGLLVRWEQSSKLAQPELVEKPHHVQMLLICLGGMCISCSLSGNWWLVDGLCPTVSGWAGGSTVDGTTTWQLSHQFRPPPMLPLTLFSSSISSSFVTWHCTLKWWLTCSHHKDKLSKRVRSPHHHTKVWGMWETNILNQHLSLTTSLRVLAVGKTQYDFLVCNRKITTLSSFSLTINN